MKLTVNRTIATDLLVIGGGIAGLRAAVAGTRCGARTVLVIKGTLGKSGSSDAAAIGISWQAADGCGGPEDSLDVHYQDIMHAAQGMADARLARILTSEAVERLQELESWGLKTFRDPDSRTPHFSGYACFGSQPRAHGVPAAGNGSHTGNMTACLRQQLLQRLTIRVALLQLRGLARQLRVVQGRDGRLERIDLRDGSRILLEQPVVPAAEDLGKNVEH